MATKYSYFNIPNLWRSHTIRAQNIHCQSKQNNSTKT